MNQVVAVNERGNRMGETHHRAKLTDEQVETMRELHQQGWGFKRLARAFNVSRETARDIVLYRRRAQLAVGWKVVVMRSIT